MQDQDAGRLYYESLRKIQRIEQHTKEAITYDSNKIHARLTFGVHADRAHMIFPAVFPKFHALYPNVTISLVNGHTNDFVEMLSSGKIDIMVGHDTEPQEGFLRETVFEEAICILATREFLKEHLPGWNDERDVIEPEEIAKLPMTCTSFGCAMMDRIRQFFTTENVMPKYLCEVVDYVTQLELCKAHHTAFFCPESYLIQKDFVEAINAEGEGRVLVLKVGRMDGRIHVEIISRKEDFIPRYQQDFRRILLEEYRTKAGK